MHLLMYITSYLQTTLESKYLYVHKTFTWLKSLTIHKYICVYICKCKFTGVCKINFFKIPNEFPTNIICTYVCTWRKE